MELPFLCFFRGSLPTVTLFSSYSFILLLLNNNLLSYLSPIPRHLSSLLITRYYSLSFITSTSHHSSPLSHFSSLLQMNKDSSSSTLPEHVVHTAILRGGTSNFSSAKGSKKFISVEQVCACVYVHIPACSFPS